ncbi:L-lactate permease [Micromonospora echinofusca]|uniref:L-lactate permease n=1 Tax=Micromonospora echinofusca TaxID=47858 RepID=UPI000C6FDE4F|nr:L-lactate permease [Micromonospora sp. MSM11]MCL7456363.1 L-lactate permease [Micromonospora sp. MSM11]
MNETSLPINVGTWLLAISPIVVLLVLLAVLRWKAPQAGPVGMFLAVLLALVFFRTPWETVAVGAGKGIWDAIFILLVIWPALLLYRIGTAAGAFDALRRGLSRYSRNHVFLVLAFGWVFASFMQGIAGFGAPIAIVAPLLLAIGVRAVYAVAIPLIGHAWANMFGTLAVGWLATLQVVELDSELTTALITAVLLAPITLMAGVTIAWMAGRGAAVRLAWPLVLIISAIHAGLQFVIMYWEPLLSNFLATTVALVALYPLSRWSRYREPARDIERRPAMSEDAGDAAEDEDARPTMGLAWAMLPYAVLTAVAVLTLAIPPVENLLDQVEFGFPFPDVTTGYDVASEGERPYSPISPFTHPGFALIVATAVTWMAFRLRGFFAAQRERAGRQSVWSSLADNAAPASVAILSFLVLAGVMEHSGLTDVLAQGIETVSPPLVYAFVANFIGLLGAFMTSSNTASNVLFSQLQQGVASGTGLSGNAIIAAQSAGGAVGNAIAPANIVLGTGTAGIVGQEGQVLRKTLPWTMAVAVVIGLLTLLFV